MKLNCRSAMARYAASLILLTASGCKHGFLPSIFRAPGPAAQWMADTSRVQPVASSVDRSADHSADRTAAHSVAHSATQEELPAAQLAMPEIATPPLPIANVAATDPPSEQPVHTSLAAMVGPPTSAVVQATGSHVGSQAFSRSLEQSPTAPSAEPIAHAMPISASTATMPSTAAESSNQNRQEITIHVANVRIGQGPVRVALFSDPSTFPSVAGAAVSASVSGDRPTVTALMSLSTDQISRAAQRGGGKIAIAVYQDINSDGQLNRNRYGIPTEPFAFSGNALARRGPPKFEEAAIALGTPGQSPACVTTITLPPASSS